MIDPMSDLTILNTYQQILSLPQAYIGSFGSPFGSGVFGGSDEDDDDRKRLKSKIEELEQTIARLSRLQHIPSDKSVFVLRLAAGEGFSEKDYEMLDTQISKYRPDVTLIVIPVEYTLEGLDDRDLASLGLKRIRANMSEKDRYDAMLLGKV